MVANSLDSNSVTGTQGSPNLESSTPQNVQPPSTPAPTQSPDQMRALVADVVREALQDENILKGMKDRRFNQFQRTLDDISPVLDRVKEILSPEQKVQFSQIQRDMEFEDLKQLVYGNQTQTGATQSGTQSSAAVDVEAIVRSFFEPNDPTLAVLKQKHAGNPVALLTDAIQAKITQAISPNPSPASGLPLNSGNASTGLTQGQIDDKLARYEELSKNYSKNRTEIKQLEGELESAGVLQKR